MAKSAKPTKKGYRKYVYKDAKTGQFVTEEYARKHPATTVREKVWVPE